MEWIEISKRRPPYGELIWVWDVENNCRYLIRYFGSEESWLEKKDNSKMPIWAHLNDIERKDEMD